MVKKFFLVRMKYFNSGEITVTSEICESKSQAMIKYYTYIEEDMEDNTLCGSSCTILNWLGENVICNNWGTIVIEENV